MNHLPKTKRAPIIWTLLTSIMTSGRTALARPLANLTSTKAFTSMASRPAKIQVIKSSYSSPARWLRARSTKSTTSWLRQLSLSYSLELSSLCWSGICSIQANSMVWTLMFKPSQLKTTLLRWILQMQCGKTFWLINFKLSEMRKMKMERPNGLRLFFSKNICMIESDKSWLSLQKTEQEKMRNTKTNTINKRWKKCQRKRQRSRKT